MVGPLIAMAALSFGGAPQDSYPTMYDPKLDLHPIATMPGPIVNGRLWVSTPIIGPEPGPLVPYFRGPGPNYYGAIDASDARVPVRVAHQVVSISPWDVIDKPGLRRFEEARQFWLRENNYIGGVRTFVNDLHLWDPPARIAGEHDVQSFTREDADVPQPRATIQLAPDQPRKRKPLRVQNPRDGQPVARVAPLVRPERMPHTAERISWPPSAPIEVVDRSRSRVHSVARGQ